MASSIQDLIDINGDKNFGVNSLPIAIGRERASLVVFIFGVFSLGAVLYYAYSNFFYSQFMTMFCPSYLYSLVLSPVDMLEKTSSNKMVLVTSQVYIYTYY